MDMDTKYNVWNKCKYDIGVQLINGLQLNIQAGKFQVMSANDILYVESICKTDKLFAKRMLVAVDQSTGKEADISVIGIPKDDALPKHLDDSEIQAELKGSIKKFEAWINNVDDPSQLHAIYDVAKKMDNLPASKLKILQAKMPNKDWLS